MPKNDSRGVAPRLTNTILGRQKKTKHLINRGRSSKKEGEKKNKLEYKQEVYIKELGSLRGGVKLRLGSGQALRLRLRTWALGA